MFSLLGKAAFDAQALAFIAQVKTGLEKAVKKMAKDGQMFATLQSPVFSGDFASNWNVSYGQPDTSYTPGTYDWGNLGPLTDATGLSPGRFSMSGFQLGQRVYLTNASEHEEGMYGWLIEDNKIRFRPNNEKKGRVGGRTLEHLSIGYGVITKGHMV